MAAKKSSERLQVVLKLAQIKQQQAAEQLAEATKALQDNQQQGQQLRTYQQEYNSHFHQFEQQPLNPQTMRNYQRFYGNLEVAIYTQDQRSQASQAQYEATRSQWQDAYGREKNMGKLVERKQLEEEKAIEDKLQRELDDRANTRMAGKKHE